MKVRFQTPNIRAKYKSTFHALATIVKEENFIGLYKGITSPLVSIANIISDPQLDISSKGLMRTLERCHFCVVWFLHESTDGIIHRDPQFDSSDPCWCGSRNCDIVSISPTSRGFGLSDLNSVITTPVELIKIRQQNSLTSKPSVLTVASQLLKTRNIRGLYRGFTATALRDVGYGAYFGSVSFFHLLIICHNE